MRPTHNYQDGFIMEQNLDHKLMPFVHWGKKEKQILEVNSRSLNSRDKNTIRDRATCPHFSVLLFPLRSLAGIHPTSRSAHFYLKAFFDICPKTKVYQPANQMKKQRTFSRVFVLPGFFSNVHEHHPEVPMPIAPVFHIHIRKERTLKCLKNHEDLSAWWFQSFQKS